jgi:hypothetical protein
MEPYRLSQRAGCLAVFGWVALIGLSAVAGAAADEAYRTYRNERFGVSADVPRSWKAGRSPDNGDGLAFTSPDGTATITISGGLNIADSVTEAMQAELTPDDGETVSYRRQTDRMAVLSGTRGTTIFYRKAILSCKDAVMSRVAIDYPLARKQEFDALVTHVARSLRGGPGAQVGSCK